MEITGSFASAAGVWSLQTTVSPSLSAVVPTVAYVPSSASHYMNMPLVALSV